MLDRLSGSRQKVQVIREVMKGSQSTPKGFPASDQVPQIASTVVSASRAITVGIDGPIVSLECGVSQAQRSL
jgi:hypothetical protein